MTKRRIKSLKFSHDKQSQEFARRVVEALKRTTYRAETDTNNYPCPNCGFTSCSAKGKGTCDYAED